MRHSAGIQKVIDAPEQQPAQLYACLDHCKHTARQCGNFWNFDGLAALKKVDFMPVMQRNPFRVRGIEICACFVAHALQNCFVLLVKRSRQSQIMPSCNSGDFQQDPIAVLDEVHRKIAHRIDGCLRERQVRELHIGHAFHHGACNKCLGLDGLDNGSWSLQGVLALWLIRLYFAVARSTRAFKAVFAVGEVSQPPAPKWAIAAARGRVRCRTVPPDRHPISRPFLSIRGILFQ